MELTARSSVPAVNWYLIQTTFYQFIKKKITTLQAYSGSTSTALQTRQKTCWTDLKIEKGESPGITETSEQHHCPPQLLEEAWCLEGGQEGGAGHIWYPISPSYWNKSKARKKLGSGAVCSQPESIAANRKMPLLLPHDTTEKNLGTAKDPDCILNTKYS